MGCHGIMMILPWAHEASVFQKHGSPRPLGFRRGQLKSLCGGRQEGLDVEEEQDSLQIHTG